MTRRGNDTFGLPGIHEIGSPDLARLDRDLRGIVIEERSSFAAELRAELAAEQARMRSGTRSYSRWTRTHRLAAASVVLLVAGTLLVPSARASLVRLLFPAPESVDALTGAEQPVAVNPLNDPTVTITVEESGAPPEVESREDVPVSRPEPAVADVVEGAEPLTPTLPDVYDRKQARRIVTEEYPVDLQQAGIGGAVRLLLWVGPDGIPETPSVRSSSGVPGLDKAALRAVSLIRFQPATRSGLPVGSWVEFSIRFVPSATGSQPAPENQAFEIPPIN